MDRYQDYVIKDGKFVGKFEEMYKKFDDPWVQSKENHHLNSYSRNAAIINIRKLNIKSIVEFGCGLGYFTNLISKMADVTVLGVDISETAVNKAKNNFPDLDFKCDNIENIGRYKDYDAILFAEITWYILDDLDEIFNMMLIDFEGKYFLHNLVFYKGNQKYGTDFFTNLDEFISYVPFPLLGSSQSTTTDSDTIETSTIFKITKKAVK